MSGSISFRIHESVQILAKLMTDKQLKLVTAESCTGGMLAQKITSISDSSKWFECGFVTYSNGSKMRMLGVQSEVLDEFGAVSEEVAEQMALGAQRNSAADIAVSVTGIAGPGGGSAIKPVGTVYIANVILNQSAITTHYQFEGDRQAIREQTTLAAISLLIDHLN